MLTSICCLSLAFRCVSWMPISYLIPAVIRTGIPSKNLLTSASIIWWTEWANKTNTGRMQPFPGSLHVFNEYAGGCVHVCIYSCACRTIAVHFELNLHTHSLYSLKKVPIQTSLPMQLNSCLFSPPHISLSTYRSFQTIQWACYTCSDTIFCTLSWE